MREHYNALELVESMLFQVAFASLECELWKRDDGLDTTLLEEFWVIEVERVSIGEGYSGGAAGRVADLVDGGVKSTSAEWVGVRGVGQHSKPLQQRPWSLISSFLSTFWIDKCALSRKEKIYSATRPSFSSISTHLFLSNSAISVTSPLCKCLLEVRDSD